MEIRNDVITSPLDLRLIAWDIGDSAGLEHILPKPVTSFTQPDSSPLTRPIAKNSFEARTNTN